MTDGESKLARSDYSERERLAWVLFTISFAGMLALAYLYATVKPKIVERSIKPSTRIREPQPQPEVLKTEEHIGNALKPVTWQPNLSFLQGTPSNEQLQNLENLIQILAKNGDPNFLNWDNSTPLHVAIWAQAPIEVISSIIERGANVNAADKNGCKPIHLAARYWRKDVLELLYQKKADVNGQANFNGLVVTPLSALIEALAQHKSESPSELLNARKQALSAARSLVDHGADVNAFIERRVGMSWGSEVYKKEAVITALAKLAADEPGIAHSKNGDYGPVRDLIKVMIEKNCNVNSESLDNSSNALLEAVLLNDVTTTQLLVERGGADVNHNFSVSKFGRQPLLSKAIATFKEDCRHQAQFCDVLDRLLRLGANVNSKDSDGATPLHWAVRGRQFDVAKLLIDHGANVNAIDLHGNTPLHTFADHYSSTFVDMLLEHGANVNTLNQNGETILDKWYAETTNSLLKHGAKREKN